MSKRFDGQVAWITGGGTGIGRGVALALAAEGAKIVVSGRRAEPLEETVATIAAGGGIASAEICDVTDDDAVHGAVRSIVDRYGRLDVAVANAGFAVAGRFEELVLDDWKRQFDVNVFGLISTVQAALPELKKTRGRVCLVGSIAAFIPMKKMGPYCASKYAVRAIGRSLDAELDGSGVSCTTVHPGYVESEIAFVDNEGKLRPDRKDKRPANLMWTADDAGEAIVKALYKRKTEFVFTGHGKFAAFMGKHFTGLAQKLT